MYWLLIGINAFLLIASMFAFSGSPKRQKAICTALVCNFMLLRLAMTFPLPADDESIVIVGECVALVLFGALLLAQKLFPGVIIAWRKE